MEMDQENRVPLTRSSSKKRAADANANAMPHSFLPQPSLAKKRVVLGELTNSPDPRGSTRNPKKRSNTVIETSPEKKPVHESLKQRKEEEPIKEIVELNKCTFASSLYEHLHSLEIEEKRRPMPNYIEKVQNDITVNMREILMEWLVEVTEEYKLVSDTLYLTVSYVDRFLSSHPISRNKLQLLGVSSMLIASKYEEITPPNVDDFCYISDNSYTKEEVVEMEKDILKQLDFEIGTPTTRNFLRILMRAADEKLRHQDLQMEFLSCYLGELSLLDYGCVKFLPSMVASAAIFLSRFMIEPKTHPWTKALESCSGYRASDLKECVLAIHGLHQKRSGSYLIAVTEKYMQHKFKFVASMSSPSEVPDQYFEAVDEG